MRLPLWNGQIKFVEEHLLDPLKWRSVHTGIRNGEGVLREKAHRDGSVTLTRERPRRIFVNSMSDLFHENVTDLMRDKIFAVMALCPQHTFQVLTKRPERMLKYIDTKVDEALEQDGRQLCVEDAVEKMLGRAISCDLIKWPLPNVHLGVSVENQKTADERIPLLLQTPAAVRFISVEPLLGPLEVSGWLDRSWPNCDNGFVQGAAMEEGYCAHCGGHVSDPIHVSPDRELDWVIVGGESGHGARPMHPEWVRSLRDQCEAAGVPFFFKQWGEFTSEQCPGVDVVLSKLNPGQCVTSGIRGHHTLYTRVGKKAAGHLLDGKEYHQFPEVR
jgi:protein gp37